jgi:ferritin
MLKKKMLDKLNDQLNFEFYSSNIYLQMSAWAENNKYAGAAVYLKKQAHEELVHMTKFFDYINETGSLAVVGKIDAPDTEYKSIQELFKIILNHEKIVTKRIHEISKMAWDDKDLTTFNFMQWFIAEQHEEETQFQGILDKFDIIGNDKRGLFMIDQELANMAQARPEIINMVE